MQHMTSATATNITAEFVPVYAPRGGVFLGFSVVLGAWAMLALGVAALVF